MPLAAQPTAPLFQQHTKPDWLDIRHADTPFISEQRNVAPLTAIAGGMLKQAPFSYLSPGPVTSAIAGLDGIALPLLHDIERLTERFVRLMGCDTVRLRLEGVTGDACWKIHSDYTDVRLITTYSGPGTQYIPYGRPADEAELVDMPTGWVGLFKGRNFHAEHAPCMHRSPQIGATGEKRLVLVVDTPLRSANA
jgi:hypothetical protein